MIEQSKTNKLICKLAYKSKILKNRYRKYGLYVSFIFSLIMIVFGLYTICFPYSPLQFPMNIIAGSFGLLGGFIAAMGVFAGDRFIEKYTTVVYIFLTLAVTSVLYLIIKLIEINVAVSLLLASVGVIEVLCIRYIYKIIERCPKFHE